MDINLPPRVAEPAWIHSWRQARELGDFRKFVEQIPALAELELQTDPIPSAPFPDKKVWVQPGQYGYEMCAYDFAAPPDQNRLCVMHPDQPTNQPLQRTLVGGLSFMVCLDCRERRFDRLRQMEDMTRIPEWSE
jgi:hypothetical protein